jgi:hypothetical protein
MSYFIYTEVTKEEQEKILNIFKKISDNHYKFVRTLQFTGEIPTHYQTSGNKNKTVVVIQYGCFEIAHTMMRLVCQYLGKKEYNLDDKEIIKDVNPKSLIKRRWFRIQKNDAWTTHRYMKYYFNKNNEY